MKTSLKITLGLLFGGVFAAAIAIGQNCGECEKATSESVVAYQDAEMNTEVFASNDFTNKCGEGCEKTTKKEPCEKTKEEAKAEVKTTSSGCGSETKTEVKTETKKELNKKKAEPTKETGSCG